MSRLLAELRITEQRLRVWVGAYEGPRGTVWELVVTARLSVSQAVRLMGDEEIDANARCGLGGVSAPGKGGSGGEDYIIRQREENEGKVRD